MSTAARRLADPEVMAHAQTRMQELLTRSTTDPAFRRSLLETPRAALAEFNGVAESRVPEALNVVFVENRGAATIVLPDFVDPSAELSESDLEAVAGGWTPVALAGIAVVAACWDAYQSGRDDAKN